MTNWNKVPSREELESFAPTMIIAAGERSAAREFEKYESYIKESDSESCFSVQHLYPTGKIRVICNASGFSYYAQ